MEKKEKNSKSLNVKEQILSAYLKIQGINRKLSKALFVINEKLDQVLLLKQNSTGEFNTKTQVLSANPTYLNSKEAANYLEITEQQLEELVKWEKIQCSISEDDEIIYLLDELDRFAFIDLEPMRFTFKF
jgi:hypothetical protein